MKILSNLCLHFARQYGQNGKNGKKIAQIKWRKYLKPKNENMGWTKQKVPRFKIPKPGNTFTRAE